MNKTEVRYRRSRSALTLALVSAALLGASLPSQAAIFLTASGGVNGRLNVNVITGDTFTLTDTPLTGNYLAVVLDGFFNNSQADVTGFANEPTTLSLGGQVGSVDANSGSIAQNDVTLNDLFLGFKSSEYGNLVVSDTVTLTPGHRESATDMILNYSTINPGGTAFLMDGFGNKVSNTVTWTTVPEPSTYAAVGGLLCLAAAIGRRKLAPKAASIR